MLRREGLFRLLQRVSSLPRFPRGLFFVGCVHVLRLERFNNRAVRRPLQCCEIRPGTEADIDALVACTRDTDPRLLRQKFAEFLAQGHICTVAWDGDVVAGYNWGFFDQYVITFDGYRRRNLRLLLDERSAFLGNGYIAEPYRLKGVFPHLAHARLKRLPGRERFYTFVADTNDASRRANRRLGMADFATVMCLTLLGLTFYLCRPAAGGRWRLLPRRRPVPVEHLGRPE